MFDVDPWTLLTIVLLGGITVISPDGAWIEHVPLPDLYTTNICFGGPDMTTAWITASGTGRRSMIGSAWADEWWKMRGSCPRNFHRRGHKVKRAAPTPAARCCRPGAPPGRRGRRGSRRSQCRHGGDAYRTHWGCGLLRLSSSTARWRTR